MTAADYDAVTNEASAVLSAYQEQLGTLDVCDAEDLGCYYSRFDKHAAATAAVKTRLARLSAATTISGCAKALTKTSQALVAIESETAQARRALFDGDASQVGELAPVHQAFVDAYSAALPACNTSSESADGGGAATTAEPVDPGVDEPDDGAAGNTRQERDANRGRAAGFASAASLGRKHTALLKICAERARAEADDYVEGTNNSAKFTTGAAERELVATARDFQKNGPVPTFTAGETYAAHLRSLAKEMRSSNCGSRAASQLEAVADDAK